MLRKYFKQIHFLIFFILVCAVSLTANASTESEITARLNSSLKILIREVPKLKSKEDAFELVRRHIIPITDISITSKLMLGKHWKVATPLQRKRFMDAMTNQLISTYSVFLLDKNASKAKFNILRITKRESKKVNKYIVYSKVTIQTPIDVIFIIYQRKGKDWKIADVSIEGISLALNWRTTLNAMIKKPGDLEKIIVQLENKFQEVN